VPSLLAKWVLPAKNYQDHRCCGKIHPTKNSFQGNLRIPEDVSVQLHIATLKMDLSARDLENKNNDKHGKTNQHPI